MYELSRVRLHAVGPAGARYQDVVLDLSEVGPVLRGEKQDALFGAGVHAADQGPVRRPSPASVLFLENGGGKSVLIKLIFSVMLPGRRQVVGTTNTRVLEKFVGAKDVAHVVLEWQHTESGQRLITGKVSEWRGHAVSADPENLIDSWYCFRPTPTLALESLPLSENGRLLTMSGFHDQLDTAHAAEPELELFRTRRHYEWTDRLDRTGLDPELFRYQRAMNAGEGEAADAFAFNTDEAFIEFLLRAVLSEEEPKDLADVLASYAHNLAQRGDLMSERDFVAGALDLLGPLAEEESVAAASRTLAERADAEVAELAGAVAARDAAENNRLSTVEGQVAELREGEQLAEGDHRRRSAVVSELRRQVGSMLLARAAEDRARVDGELATAKAEADAWRESGRVLAQLNAARKASDLRDLVGTKEIKAQPALEAKNAAALALARGLLGLAAQAREQAETAERTVAELTADAGRAQEERDAATTQAAARRAEVDSLSARIAEVRAEIADAVRRQRLGTGVDVEEAARTAAAEAESAATELTRRDEEYERLTESVATAQVEVNDAHRLAGSAADRRERLVDERDRAHRRMDALAVEPRFGELLGSEDDVRLESDLPTLLERLRAANESAEAEQTTLRMAESTDRRALAALGEGGLLPPPEEVAEALEVLAEGGIHAWSGWRYLSGMPADRRAATLKRFPYLVGGLLLNDRAQIERAEELLADKRLLPSSIIGVGVRTSLQDKESGDGDVSGVSGLEFLVPPNPAMYDEDAADTERQTITSAQAERAERLRDITARIAADNALIWKLTAWREDFPAGAIAELAERAQEAITAAGQAESAHREAKDELDRLSGKRTALRERLPELRRAATDSGERARVLRELATRAARIPEWTETVERAGEAAARATAEAEKAGATAARQRERAAEEQRTADGHRRTAATAHAELAQVPGGGSVSADDPAPKEPVDTLRGSFAEAAESYAKVEVGSDLRAELEQAESAESATRAAVEALPDNVRARAAALLETPDGSDASARSAAQSRAVRAVDALEAERTEAVSLVATREAELAGLPQQPGALDSTGRPRDVEHGMELIDAANTEVSAIARKWEEIRRQRADAEEHLETARVSASGFGVLAESLAPHVPADNGETSPYDGDLDTAKAGHSSLSGALNDARAAVDRAERRVREAADALAQYATEKRFDQLTTPVRQQVISVRRDALPGNASAWAEALRPRLRSLTDDLDQIDRHRSGIIARLQGMVDGALRLLRSAQRVSRLPEGLGEWSGQEFLRIRFTELEEDVLAERLGEVVDEAAAGKTSDGRDVKRDGMSLLLRGVQAAAPKGFRVDMLKPDSVLRTERQRVSEIRDVFSGGQQLTAAIILYCTMAALRANNRGKLRNRHSGVLFLDNPIGRASAGYLLELQRAVAEALGVQLIYTTGLFDAGALSEFPLIVRLRNDADLRAGRKYLSVDATIRKHLPEGDDGAAAGGSDGAALLSATRLYHKQEATVAAATTGGDQD